jgi:2-C-methyl-D-erythritol 4-phosphate cytidylyltransferase
MMSLVLTCLGVLAMAVVVIGVLIISRSIARPLSVITDTIKRVADGVVVETPDRATLVAVQTPQAFSRAALLAAHAAGGEATDDAALVEADGGRIVVVAGEITNFKITRRDDLDRAEQILHR